jgi:hypothetical chaperone protein
MNWALKEALSTHESAEFSFIEQGIEIKKVVARRDFETWIEPDLMAISRTVDTLLQNTNLTPIDIDHVFMTGGTSFVPAVQHLMAQKLGAHKMSAGGEFTSVSAGLAMIAQEKQSKSAAA